MVVVTDTQAELYTGPTVHEPAAETSRLRRFRPWSRGNRKQAPQPPLPKSQAPLEQIGERRQGDRRKKDGLGLLPPALTPQERENRSTLNMLIGALLSAFGAFIAAGGAGMLGPGFTWNTLWSIILGIAMLGQGLRLVGRRERRRSGRRKVRTKERV